AYINRAETYFLMGEYYLALMDLRTAESLFPNNLLVAADVALTLHAIGEVSAACSVWQGLMDEELGFCDVGWLRREFEWLDPLIDRARMILRDLM
nr:tetratricopeptide repeat protein [Anaerolineae bacterium]